MFHFQGEIFKLEFLEEGKYCNQTMMVNENSIEFDVPQHANIQETHYLYDYEAVSPWVLFLNILKIKNHQKYKHYTKKEAFLSWFLQ